MKVPRVVIDTNVLVSALRSKRGTSFRLLSLVGGGKFETCLSSALLFEYEDAAKRLLKTLPLTEQVIDDILDYLCATAHHQSVYFLWRPYLRDPEDDFILELAVAAQCGYIVTHNLRDFAGIEPFGIEALSPRAFLTGVLHERH